MSSVLSVEGEVNPPSHSIEDSTMKDSDDQSQHIPQKDMNSGTKSVLSFREVVASSSQWFSEARKIISTSKEWDDSEEIV